MMQSASIRSWIAALLVAGLSAGADGATLSYTAYARVLGDYVDGAGKVDYDQLAEQRSDLDTFTRELATLDRDIYAGWPEADQLAFWMNAYNALTLKAVVDHYPVKSIKDIGGIFTSVWDKLKFEVMGETMTLNHIEHEILRKRFSEPRIHMAINCASIGCPPLGNTPLRGTVLDRQFSQLTRRFLADGAKFRIDREAGIVHLSPIFKWFGEDFTETYGIKGRLPGLSIDQSASVHFIADHLEPAPGGWLLTHRYKIKYLPYDWGLNRQETGKPARVPD